MGCVGCPECSAVLTLSVLDRGCVGVGVVPVSVAAIGVDDDDDDDDDDANKSSSSFTHLCVYKCGYCHWDSTECGIYQLFDNDNDNENNDEDGAEKMKVATIELQKKLTAKLEMKEQTLLFQKLLSSWGTKTDNLEKMKRRVTLLSKGSGSGSGNRIRSNIANDLDVTEEKKRSDNGSWSVESLEDAMKQRREKMAKQVTQSISIQGGGGVQVNNQSVLTVGDHVTVDDDSDRILCNGPLQQSRQQIVSTTAQHQQLLPIPLCLRARAVKRCLKELEAGRPGILVKPKVNPLDGDTSLRYGHGQWWKKDSSAIHSVPRVQIQEHKFNPSTSQHALLFQLKNPTLGPVRLRIHSNFHETTTTTTSFPESYNAVLDSMTLQSEVVNVIPPTPSDAMDRFVLEAVEDAFLDIGTGTDVGGNVHGWGASASASDIEWSEERNCKLIGVINDMAWVQFVTAGLGESVSDGKFMATPLILEIEVGDDSWESSLIQARDMKDGGKDCVSFTILPVWRRDD